MGGINIRPMEPELLGKCMAIARRIRNEEETARAEKRRQAYAAAAAQARPWISLQEAMHELDVSQGRISQLISRKQVTARRDPDRPGRKQVLAAEIYAFKTTPIKKTRTKK